MQKKYTSLAVFGNGLDWRKLISTVVDLIDVRKKSKNVLYKKVKFFYL